MPSQMFNAEIRGKAIEEKWSQDYPWNVEHMAFEQDQSGHHTGHLNNLNNLSKQPGYFCNGLSLKKICLKLHSHALI